MELLETRINCPYCWQILTIFLDPSIPETDYVEDCQVCCQPIHIQAGVNDIHELEWIDATRENE